MSSYDQNLLDEAPQATRAQMQEGYNIDLLEQPPRRTPSMHNPSPQHQTAHTHPPLPPLAPTIPENDSGEKYGSPVYVPLSPPRKSFWRSRNGIITIIFIAIIVVGAVIGGAVGGTVGKKSPQNLSGAGNTNSPTATRTTPGLTQGVGSSVTGSGVNPAQETPSNASMESFSS